VLAQIVDTSLHQASKFQVQCVTRPRQNGSKSANVVHWYLVPTPNNHPRSCHLCGSRPVSPNWVTDRDRNFNGPSATIFRVPAQFVHMCRSEGRSLRLCEPRTLAEFDSSSIPLLHTDVMRSYDEPTFVHSLSTLSVLQSLPS
jgi:hypothetical protein